MNKIFQSLLIVFVLGNNFSLAQNLIVIKDAEASNNVFNSIYYLNDKEGQLSIRDILKAEFQSKFVQNKEEPLNTDMGFKSVWLKFNLQNKTGKELFLKLENIDIPEIEIYTPQNQPDSFQVKKMGIIYPNGNKEVTSRFFIIRLSDGKDTNDQTFYIRINQIIHHEIPMHIGSAQNLLSDSIITDVFFGILFGIMLIMFVYNLYIYVLIREIGYLYYTIHILSSFAFTLIISGYGLLFFWSNYPQLNNYFGFGAIFTTIIIIIPFASTILETQKYAPFWHKGFRIFLVLLLLSFVLVFFNSMIGFGLVQLLLLLLFVYIFIVGIIAYNGGNKIARFYIVGNMAYLVGMIILFLKGGKVLPVNWFTMHANYLGTAFEILFISFALADKIRFINRERAKAQAENLKLVEEQKETLEGMVRERTQDLENANSEIITQNEELKQVQEEIIAQRDFIENQNKNLTHQNTQIKSSINAALTIQKAILPFDTQLNKILKEYYILYQPKDIVSGDFYWIDRLNEKIILVAADCTGHGVPGAFMSLISSNLLEKVILAGLNSDPATMLTHLHNKVRIALNQAEHHNNNGLDIGIAILEQEDSTHQKITFAGAKRPMYFISADNPQEVQIISGTRKSIGGIQNESISFENHTVSLPLNSMMFLSSDGLIDQNDAKRNRLGSKRLFETLIENFSLNSQQQRLSLLKLLSEQLQGTTQRDDILWIGLRI